MPADTPARAKQEEREMMMMEQTGAKFEGWALIELFGHNREAGYVTTQYFGDKAMFQIDVPEIPARQETLKAPKWGDSGLMPVGTVIEREAIPGRTRLVNPGAVYAMNPATEEVIRDGIARSEQRAIKVISLPAVAERTLLPGEPEEDRRDSGDFDDQYDEADEIDETTPA